jgi:hypothetical protein
MNPTLETIMKTKITALALLSVAALSFAPKPAHAGDKELAAIGGFIGGVIVGSVLNKGHTDVYCPPAPPVVVVHHDRRHGHGYWHENRVKVWVPARWVYERDRRGHSVKRYVAGYYDYRTERVWVATSHGHPHHAPRYGYSPRR